MIVLEDICTLAIQIVEVIEPVFENTKDKVNVPELLIWKGKL
jgi:hypothetical protein